MSTVRFSQVTFATKSWVAEAWEKMVVELFSGRVVAEVKQLDEVCESKWEVELKHNPNNTKATINESTGQITITGLKQGQCGMVMVTASIAPDSRLLSTGVTG